MDIWVNGVTFLNVSDQPTPGNRPLTVGEIKANLVRLDADIKAHNPERIVAVGKTATKALTLLQLQFLEIPHPSGCNRKLNDPKVVEEVIKKLQSYLELP
jgi:uracil-DNA glycosylase